MPRGQYDRTHLKHASEESAPEQYRGPRKTTGYTGNSNTVKERRWYAALADKVGFRNAPKYVDDIIIWKQGRPPAHILENWLRDYDDAKFDVPDDIRVRVENRVERFHKQKHMGFLQRMIASGHRALDPVEETGDMKQPVILKYIADGVNQGMMLHSSRAAAAMETMGLGGLTINIGNKPPPRKLKQKDVDKIMDAEFSVIPERTTVDNI